MTNGKPEGDTMHNNNYSRPAIKRIVSRRSALGLLEFGAACAALTPTFPKTAQAQNRNQNKPSPPAPNQPSQIVTRESPRTKEKVPAIGLGTFMTFDVLSNQPRDHLQQVMRRFWGCVAKSYRRQNNYLCGSRLGSNSKNLSNEFDLP